MKFVYDHLVHICSGSFPQSYIREDFGGAAKNGRITIHRGITCAQSDVFRAELTAQRKPFFIHQCLDGAGIDRAFALGEPLEMHGLRHQRFAGTCRSIKNNVLFVEQLQDRRLLRWIKLQTSGSDVVKKSSQQQIVGRIISLWNQIVKSYWH